MAKAGRSLGGLWRYLLVRFLLIFPTILILVTVVFFLIRSTGDPITLSMGDRLSAEDLANRIHLAGYDRPLIVQYLDYLGGLIHGDFGTTYSDHLPVTEVVTRYGSATLELAVYALLVAGIVGIPLGMLAAYIRDRWGDAVLRILAVVFYATPIFFSGLLFKLVFSSWLHWLPASGRANTIDDLYLRSVPSPTGIYLLDAFQTRQPGVVLGDVLSHAVLPGLALGLLTAGIFLRLVRTNVIATYNTGYIDAARSRGVGDHRLLTKHAWRPALIPIITVIGLQVAMLLGGAVLTETTFEWGGLGYQLNHYVQARDFVAVQGIVAVIAVIVAVVNFVVDAIAALIDPRVRY